MKSLRFKILAYLISFLCLSVVVMTTAIGIRTESHMLAEEEMRFEEMLDTIEVYLNAEKNIARIFLPIEKMNYEI